MDQNTTGQDGAVETLTTEDHATHSLGRRILHGLLGVPDETRGALAAEAERLQSHAERLHHQVRRVRAVIDSPRTMGARSMSFPDAEPELLVFVKDVRAALDGPAPDTVTPTGAGGTPTTNGSIIFFDTGEYGAPPPVGQEAHLVNGAWRWADSGGAVSQRELIEEDWVLVRDAGAGDASPVPGQLRWKFDNGRGAMLDQSNRIVGYYKAPTLKLPTADQLRAALPERDLDANEVNQVLSMLAENTTGTGE
jgi:hypothetical protein